MKNTLVVFSMLFLHLTLTPSVQAQVESYFPTQVGTTWIYSVNPDYPSRYKERNVIREVVVSLLDSSRLLYINNESNPRYRIDSSMNVFLDPLGTAKTSNLLLLKQKAQVREAWTMTDTLRDTSQARRVARIKEIGYDILFGNKIVKYKEVEWGTTVAPDTFGFSNRSEFYAQDLGLYLVIIEPQVTDKILVGFISTHDSLGDITKVLRSDIAEQNFQLYQNFPNPFNPSTTISYQITDAADVSLKIYNTVGQEVATLVEEEKNPGYYSVNWNASDMPSGLYFYRLIEGKFLGTKKMLLMK